jgi:very-short-patch-repair endonuclease
VQDPASRTAVWLDLAYPEHQVGIEYEGAHHTERDAVLRDAGRYTRLVDAGRRIYRYTPLDMRDPARIVAEIRRAIAGNGPPLLFRGCAQR